MRARLPKAAAALLAAGVRLGPAGVTRAATPDFACNPDSTLTLLGLDTAAGRALFSAPPARSGEPSWWIEVDLTDGAAPLAQYRPQRAERRPFAGSFGPGPLFAIARCGDGCLQAVHWSPRAEDAPGDEHAPGAGSWQPLGPPLPADGGTVHTTRDRSGRPWVVLHRARSGGGAGSEDGVEATAYVLTDDPAPRWQDRGTLAVRVTGTVGAVPDPTREDAVLSGTGRFSVSASPRPWVAGLPKLPADRRGELVPAGSGNDSDRGAALLDTAYSLYTTGDGGESWQRQRWTPWGSPKARLWEPGRDYWLDLPAYDRNGPLALAWFDRRKRDEHRLILATWEPSGSWRTVASLPPSTQTLDGVALVFDHILHPRPDTWVLLTGCVLTASGPGVGLRTVVGAEVSAPRFLPFRPAGR